MAILAATAFWSCRTVDDPEDFWGWQNFEARIPGVSDDLWPESIRWHVAEDFGEVRVPAVDTSFGISIAHWGAPSETVWVDLRKAGVRYVRAGFVFRNSSELVLVARTDDSVAIGILRRILPCATESRFDSAYARALVDGDPLVRDAGFPKTFPVGVDTGRVLRDAMLEMVAKRIPLAAIVRNWALGIDTLEVHARVRILAEAGLVTDTSKIFPPYPVRVVSAIGLDPVLVAGGAGAAVSGRFVAVGGVAGLDVEIWHEMSDATDSFVLENTLSLLGRPENVVLSDQLSIAAPWRVQPGSYRLTVTVRDDSGRTASSSVVFRVEPAQSNASRTDRDGPTIGILSPASGARLEHEEDPVEVTIDVRDSSGVDSVWIDGRKAVPIAGLWVLSGVRIPTDDTGYVVVIGARDRLGNVSISTLRLFREATGKAVDSAAPISKIVRPAQGALLPYDSSSVEILWKVFDPHGAIDMVAGDGVAGIRKSDSVWSVVVPLPPTGAPSKISLVATENGRIAVRDSVLVIRAGDRDAPNLVRIAGSRTVGADSTTATVSWRVRDDHGPRSVRIAGLEVSGSEGVYSSRVPLEPGPNVVRIEAIDSSGNIATDSVSVFRVFRDTIRPSVVRTDSTGDRLVPYDSATIRVSWQVSDASPVTVAIAGVEVAGLGGIYARSMTLAPASSMVVRLVARDSAGNVSTDSVTLVRGDKDTLAPAIVRTGSTGDRVLPYDSATVWVSWKVVDASPFRVSIGGVEVAEVGGIYRQAVTTEPGGTSLVRIVARDSLGNVSTDSVRLLRSNRDSLAPLLSRLGATSDRMLPYDSAVVFVSWHVSDASPVKVAIGGVEVLGSAGVYSRFVVVDPASTLVVRMVARDSAGSVSTDSVTLVRDNKDTLAPSIVRQPGTTDSVVPYSIGSIGLSWKITDPSPFQVYINGFEVQGVDGIYSTSVVMLMSSETEIVAIDSLGNRSSDTIELVKAKDTMPPRLKRMGGLADTTTVPASVDTYTVGWNVEDDGVLKSVLIDNVPVAMQADGGFWRNVALQIGDNAIGIVAIDQSGNPASETVVIHREAQ